MGCIDDEILTGIYNKFFSIINFENSILSIVAINKHFIAKVS